MKPLVAALAFSSLIFASGADAGRVPRSKMANMEKLINTQIAAMYPEEPYFLIGLARGTYLEGFGAVFSAEINLATGPSLSPFKQTISREEIQRHRDKKEVRLPLLRNRMTAIVSSMAATLENLPPTEEFVLSITLLRYPWEENFGPSQIVMRVQRGRLLDSARVSAKPETVIRTQEY
jgi:hypothetical protein